MPGTRQQRLVGVVDGLIDRLRRPPATGRRRSLLLVAAALLFLGAMAFAVGSLPDGELHVRWPLVVLTGVVGAPALLVMNGVEYAMSARLVGHRVDRRDAMAVAVYGGAANLLPLPGTALVRLQALTRQGAGVRRAAGSTGIVAIAWLGAAGFVGAPAAALGGTWWLAAVLLAGAGATVPLVRASTTRLGRSAPGAPAARHGDARAARVETAEPTPGDARTTAGPSAAVSEVDAAPTTGRLTAELYVLEIAMIVVRGLRFWLVMLAFDLDASILTAFVLPVAGVLASALGFLPGGLGIREVIAGALSGANGDPSAVGVLTSGLDRVIALPVLSVCALALAAWERRHPRPDPVAPTASTALEDAS